MEVEEPHNALEQERLYKDLFFVYNSSKLYLEELQTSSIISPDFRLILDLNKSDNLIDIYKGGGVGYIEQTLRKTSK